MSTELMSKQELKELSINEEIIENGLRGFIDVGQALSEIRNRRLWRNNFDNFKEYLNERWGFGTSYASRLINGSEVAARLPDVINEGQAREMLKIPYTDKEKVLERAKTNANSALRSLTAEDIRIAAREPSVMTYRHTDEDAVWEERELSELWGATEDMLKEIKQLTRRLSLHPEGCWLQPHAETLEVRIRDINRIIESSKPHAPCPTCCGGMLKGCETCRDRGWLPKDRYSVAKQVEKEKSST